MTQALLLAVPESRTLSLSACQEGKYYGVRLSPPLPDDATGSIQVAGPE